MPDEAEQPLSGGRVTQGIVRVGDTVRRPVGPRSDFVHELLLFLERSGFDGAPRFLGLDDRGREILSRVPGEPIPGTAILTDDHIASAAMVLRRYHDAASASSLAGGAETVVHGDPGPWNILWLGDRAAALVDFDEARPGRRGEESRLLRVERTAFHARRPAAPGAAPPPGPARKELRRARRRRAAVVDRGRDRLAVRERRQRRLARGSVERDRRGARVGRQAAS